MSVRQCTMHFTGAAPYSSSYPHEAPKLPKETANDYEERTWKLKARVEGGFVCIDPMAFRFAIGRAAKMLGQQIPGKGKATYTKFFESGVLVNSGLIAIAPEEDIQAQRVFCHANGIRGSGTRVWRKFPTVEEWAGQITFTIIADEITEEVFEAHAHYAGTIVGVGRFRPENGGYLGRFGIDRFDWAKGV